jgi:hypothetical protein
MAHRSLLALRTRIARLGTDRSALLADLDQPGYYAAGTRAVSWD